MYLKQIFMERPGLWFSFIAISITVGVFYFAPELTETPRDRFFDLKREIYAGARDITDSGFLERDASEVNEILTTYEENVIEMNSIPCEEIYERKYYARGRRYSRQWGSSKTYQEIDIEECIEYKTIHVDYVNLKQFQSLRSEYKVKVMMNNGS